MKKTMVKAFVLAALCAVPFPLFAAVSGDTIISINQHGRAYIPDGCEVESPHLLSSVTVTGFSDSSRIRTVDGIRSICVNLEHSYSADVTAAIVCPTGKHAVLFYGRLGSHFNFYEDWGVPSPAMEEQLANEAGYTGNNIGLGHFLKGIYDSRETCDSLQSPFGIGLDYCFSRSEGYTLVTGTAADSVEGRPAGGWYIKSAPNSNNTAPYGSVQFPAIPSHFTLEGGNIPEFSYSASIRRPSNHSEKTAYYLPYSDFTELIGCPINGEWGLKVIDGWGVDNGWVFGWNIDLDAVSVEARTSDPSKGSVEGGGLFMRGESVTLTASPAPGYSFLRWSDGDTNAQRTWEADESVSLTALFTSEQDIFTVIALSSDTAMGVTFGGSRYAKGETATLYALTQRGYSFQGWDDGCDDNPYRLRVLSDTVVTALFAAPDTVYIDEQGVDGIESVDAKVYTIGGQIMVEGAESHAVALYDAMGRVLEQRQATGGRATFEVPAKGVYLVKIGNTAVRKVVVAR